MDAVRDAVAGMRRLVEVVQELALARDPATVMDIVRRAARELTGADGATFVLRDGDRCYYAEEDAIAPLWKGQRFPMSACISGWVMLHREPTAIEDIYSDPRIPHDAYRPTFVKSLAMVPIRTADPIGAIGNYWASRHLPEPGEMELLRALADATAVAFENLRLHSELERRVAERSAELDAAHRELGMISRVVSEELQSPLLAIASDCAALRRAHAGTLDSDAQRRLESVAHESRRLSSMVHGLAALSRVGFEPIERETIDMAVMVRQVVARMRGEATGGLPTVEFRIGALPPAPGDRRLIEQVWTRLLSNAVKFSSRRPSPRIEVDGVSDGGECRFSVRDNGAGFAPASRDRVFDAFQRLPDGGDEVGTSIGLALVKRIVERHGGRVEAEGRPGEGATFRFTLPVAARDP